MRNRGLLTEDDREFFRGEKDVADPSQSSRSRRHRIRQRIDNLSDDLEILREADEDAVLREFYEKTSRFERLEEELEALIDERE